jgi:hypothetical protein
LERITDAILAGKVTVPIAAAFPMEQIRDAVTLQAERNVHGKECGHAVTGTGHEAEP